MNRLSMFSSKLFLPSSKFFKYAARAVLLSIRISTSISFAIVSWFHSNNKDAQICQSKVNEINGCGHVVKTLHSLSSTCHDKSLHGTRTQVHFHDGSRKSIVLCKIFSAANQIRFLFLCLNFVFCTHRPVDST